MSAVEKDSRLWHHCRNIADAATELAFKNDCIEKWYIAADLWDRAIEFAEFSPFQVRLTESMFIGRFNLWIKHHPHLRGKHKLKAGQK